jgi:hypothetical protein
MLRGGRSYLWMTLLALAVAAISLHWPSTPSYDPWSWLIWGREILHGNLGIAGGSSWKPLPVIFTTVFSLFGSAQPNLWLIVARAGALMSVLMSAKLAGRITWNIIAQYREHSPLSELSLGERLGVVAPVILAALIALVGTGLTPTYPVPMMLGYSEGLGFAITLIAIERAWDGHHRQAFALGLLPCLDRPELWIVWGLYGLWLMWRDRRTIPFVLGLGVLMLALWVGPQLLGGGKLSDLFSHAQHNHSLHSAVNSSFPFWHELSVTLWPLALERVEAAALIMMAVTAWLVVRDRPAQGGWIASMRRHGAPVAGSLSALVGFLWWLGVSLETQAGFAGNTRYAILGGLLVYVGGAAAYGWACLGLARAGGELLRRRSRRDTSLSLRLALASVLMLLVFMFVPNWFAHRLPSVRGIRYALRYQAQLRERFSALIQREGGPANILKCGSILTNNYQVTMLAWDLDVPIPWVQALPRELETTRGANVVFQDGATSSAASKQRPTIVQMGNWEAGWQAYSNTRYKIVHTDPVTLYMNCSSYYNPRSPKA